uniref:Epithelial sodium channel subunit alpha n=1 Tax=Latimeria chalumnae TaxID=7897 RepID=H3AJ42_LATCH
MSEKKEEKSKGLIEFYSSYSDLFQFFCSTTTIHGAIRLVCTERNKMKTAFWSMLFVASFGLMYWQFGIIFGHYFSYPVSMSLTLEHKKLLFPAVTVCTLNPYRYKEVESELKELDSLTADTLFELYRYNTSQHGTSDDSMQSDIRRSNRIILSAPDRVPLQVLDEPAAEHARTENQMAGTDINNPALYKGEFRKIGFKLCNASGLSCFYQAYSSGMDAVREWYMFHYVNIMVQVPMVTNPLQETHIRDFVFSCKFNHASCNQGNYTYFNHPVYGNCYTFNGGSTGNLWSSTKPGRENGLSLLLRTEQNDYIPFLSTVAGARVMIHRQNQPPFMEDEGFNIRPGVETSISMKKVSRQQLGGLYSDCTEDGSDIGVENLYNSNYTQQACVRSCFQVTLVQRCGCGHYFYPLPEGAQYCNYKKHKTWGHCYYRLYKEFKANDLGCFTKCRKRCLESEYHQMTGYSKWPAKDSGKWIHHILAKQNQYNFTTNSREDVSKLTVYFQELHHKTVGESPSINAATLLSNLGSQWSFWFGSSVLSVIEMVELLIDFFVLSTILLFRHYCIQREENQDPEITISTVSYPHYANENSEFNSEESMGNHFDVVADVSAPPAYETLDLDLPPSAAQCITGCKCVHCASFISHEVEDLMSDLAGDP